MGRSFFSRRSRCWWILALVPFLFACSSPKDLIDSALDTKQIKLGTQIGSFGLGITGYQEGFVALDSFLEQAQIMAEEVTGNTDVLVTYSPPYMPVVITKSLRTGKWGLGSGLRYHTSVGTFGIELSSAEQQQLVDQLKALKAGPADLILILEDRNRGERDVLHVKYGHDAQVLLDGHVMATFKSTEYGVIILLDVTNAQTVKLYPNDTDHGIIPEFQLDDPQPQLKRADLGGQSSDTQNGGIQSESTQNTPQTNGECILPDIIEFSIVPTGKRFEYYCTWRVEGAELVEMWGERLPHEGSKTLIIKEPGYWVIWAKAPGTADDCFTERSLKIDP
ncbi:MAG: hypothetical protein ACK2T4_09080 [Candidatus Promineifilaceae bacterium]|jgi:hypothetical protein